MKPLKAFLCYKDRAGAWTTATFRELEPLLEAWQESRNSGPSGAAIHVGFWRPETTAVALLVEQYPGMLLLSEAARHALVGPLVASEKCVGQIDSLGFRLALRGFGYELPDPTIEVEQAVPALAPTSVPTEALGDSSKVTPGWVGDLSTLSNELRGLASQSEISDEVSYLEREGALSHSARQKLGIARFRLQTGLQPTADNILNNIRACPPWFRSTSLQSLQLTARQANVFRACGLTKIDDLATFGSIGLFKLNNMGQKSVNELAASLYRLMLNGPARSLLDLTSGLPVAASNVGIATDLFSGLADAAEPDLTNVRDAIVAAVQCLKSNQRGVLAARMGFQCARMTLNEISDSIGVTRERVRQIEVKICNILRSQSCWREIEIRIEGILEGRTTPLLLEGLPAIDPWFEGLANARGPMEFIFDKLLDGRLGVIDIEGALCVSRLTSAEWDSELRSAKKLLEGCVQDQMPEDEVRHMVESLLVGRGEELRGELWEIASRSAHFAELSTGRRHLMAYGRSAEGVVFAVLAGSRVPLHYSEIHKRVADQADEPVDVRRVHSAASHVGILFARGTFGLPIHCPLESAELASIRAEVEDLVASEAPDRQWHCMELCDALVERGFSFDERLSKYIVNYALKDSPRLAYLGRLVWGLTESWRESASSRIDVRQAVISLLERQGRPMTTSEIRSHLEMERGVDVHFQIFPVEPLVRTGPSEWGLLHRDLKLDLDSAHRLLIRLRERLLHLGRGIHLTEIQQETAGAGGAVNFGNVNHHWISTLARQAGLRIDKAQYVYLPDWGSSRRMGVQDSVRAALAEYGAGGASIEDIWHRAGQLSQRLCPKLMISQALQSVDAVFDPISGRWHAEDSIAPIDIEEDQSA